MKVFLKMLDEREVCLYAIPPCQIGEPTFYVHWNVGDNYYRLLCFNFSNDMQPWLWGMQGTIVSQIHVLMLFMLHSLSSKGGWSQIWASHTYGTFKLYNIYIDCDATFWSTTIVCCLARYCSWWRFHVIHYEEIVHN